MKSKLARILRKWADLIDPKVKPYDAKVVTIRIEADTEDAMKELERVEQIVKRVVADLATVSTQASLKAIAKQQARKPKAK